MQRQVAGKCKPRLVGEGAAVAVPEQVTSPQETTEKACDKCGKVNEAVKETRPRLKMTIGGQEVEALVDSGSTHSFLSASLGEVWKKMGIAKDKRHRKITMANGTVDETLGSVNVPIRLGSSAEFTQTFRIANFPTPIVVGTDFMRRCRMILSFEDEGDPLIKVRMTRGPADGTAEAEDDEIICAGIRELDESQDQELKRLLDRVLAFPQPKLGLTKLAEHKIDVQGHPPIRQRMRPVSPVVMAAMHKAVRKMLDEGVVVPSKSEWSSHQL